MGALRVGLQAGNVVQTRGGVLDMGMGPRHGDGVIDLEKPKFSLQGEGTFSDDI